MTPRARADIRMNLPALQKLDSILLKILDSMVDTEFWYTESEAEGSSSAGHSTRWCLPSPKVPIAIKRSKLLNQGKLVKQILKAAKAINENVLAEMPVPTMIKDTLPKVAEILKDRPSWYRDCRAVEVLNMLPTANGGTIELLYMQLFAPTTLAPPHDFWLLRYTTVTEDDSLVVCERSLGNTQNGPSMPLVQNFVRAEMLPSGYLIRPCEGGGSIVHIADHANLESWSVPEVLRPLYESSAVLAQKTSMAALHQLRQISLEVSQPPDKLMGLNLLFADEFTSLSNAVLCAKASMLLQSVTPAILLRFLRVHRSEWVDNNIDAYSAAAVKVGPCSLPGAGVSNFGGQVILPLAHTVEHEELLEVIKLKGVCHSPEDVMMARDMFLLQMCSGMDENAAGTCAELIFAPIDDSFTDDAPLLPSGFRIIPLDSAKDASSPNRTLDLTSALETGQAESKVANDLKSTGGASKSIMTIAFQFAFESHMQENVASMARKYVRSFISSVQRVALALSPSHFGSL